MEMGKCLSLLALSLFTLLVLYGDGTEACSCMPEHPQSHYCTADYVAVIRVLRKSRRLAPNKLVYKVEVKKSYKMNQEAHKMLKHGRILSSDSDAGCGVQLEMGKLYMIAGKAPMLNQCQYVKEYMKMSLLERRGFAGLYRKGCSCEIKPCFGRQCLRLVESSTSCKWSPFFKCETEMSACLPHAFRTPEGVISKCDWRRTPQYKACRADP